jgi:hypothetical protein
MYLKEYNNKKKYSLEAKFYITENGALYRFKVLKMDLRLIKLLEMRFHTLLHVMKFYVWC